MLQCGFPRQMPRVAPRREQEIRARALERRGIELGSAEITLVPKTTITLDEKKTFQNMNLISSLEDHDDVQQVYSNLDISDELMTKYEARA